MFIILLNAVVIHLLWLSRDYARRNRNRLHSYRPGRRSPGSSSYKISQTETLQIPYNIVNPFAQLRRRFLRSRARGVILLPQSSRRTRVLFFFFFVVENLIYILCKNEMNIRRLTVVRRRAYDAVRGDIRPMTKCAWARNVFMFPNAADGWFTNVPAEKFSAL